MKSRNNFKYIRTRTLLLPWKMTYMYCCLKLGIGYWGACFNKICSSLHLSWLPHYCLFAWLSTNTMPCCSCCNYVFTTWILIKLLLFLLYQLNWRYVQNNSSCCWGGFKVLDSSFSLVFFSISSEIHQTLDGVEFYDSSWVLSVFVNVWCFQHWNTILSVLLWPQILIFYMKMITKTCKLICCESIFHMNPIILFS